MKILAVVSPSVAERMRTISPPRSRRGNEAQIAPGREAARAASWFFDFLLLTKARVNLLVVATTLAGFALHSSIMSGWFILLQTLIGTALVAGSAAVANQVLEQSFDRQMARTRNRPLAAGRWRRRSAVLIGGMLLVAGCLWLGVGVNLNALLLAFLAFLIYVFAYTPLKRINPACTFVGAVPGALPALVGWAATGVAFGRWAFIAFAGLFVWQIPHFLAIAWWCRSDYLRGGYHVLPFDDQRGYWTAGSALVYAAATVAVSFVPAWLHQVTGWYWPGALILGILFLVASIRFLTIRSQTTARALFFISLAYLPGLYLLMLLCRING